MLCVCGMRMSMSSSMSHIVSVPEWSKGVDSSSTVFALVGSYPSADIARTRAKAPFF